MNASASNEKKKGGGEPMRAFTTARIVALVLIGLVVLGFGYLHVTSGDDAVSVPSGAKAGDLILEDCHYATEGGSYAADCGTLVVPENRHDADSRLIALPVTRIRSRSADAAEPIFRLQGGPGISNMTFPAASRFADKRDVVLVGYRGVEGSSILDCPEVTASREHARGFLTEKAMRADTAAYRDCAERLSDDGVDLAGYTLPQRVDDLDAVRKALGYSRIDLLSESAGTRTAMIYAWRYPKRIHRSVMLGANPPGNFLWDAKTTGVQIERYAALCANDASCRARTPDLTASIHSAYAKLPDHWWFLPIRKGNVRLGAFFGLMHATTDGAGPLNGPWTVDTLLDADEGDGGGAWLMSLMAQAIFPRAQVWGDVVAVGRADAVHARRFFATHGGSGSVIGSPGTDFYMAGGGTFDAWPASPDENLYTRVRDSKVETLLVGGRLDVATPPQNGTRELLPHLSNGHEVVLPDIGHTDDFWTYQTPASNRLINTFFDSGRVDTSLYTRTAVDFTPALGHGGIAAIVLGAMLGLAALTVLSLVLMALRVRWRGPFGRKSSVVLRAVYPLVLGLGGLVLGILIVLTTNAGIGVVDELVVALSVGVPIGLGIYLAWVNRVSSATPTGTGLAAAMAGALVGAWLGFNVTDAGFGFLAPFVAIVGATAGANLALILLDIAWDRQGRVRSAETDAKETLEAQPSTG
jgi:pimeloyl-ACP methyl ester carboxylesterase